MVGMSAIFSHKTWQEPQSWMTNQGFRSVLNCKGQNWKINRFDPPNGLSSDKSCISIVAKVNDGVLQFHIPFIIAETVERVDQSGIQPGGTNCFSWMLQLWLLRVVVAILLINTKFYFLLVGPYFILPLDSFSVGTRPSLSPQETPKTGKHVSPMRPLNFQFVFCDLAGSDWFVVFFVERCGAQRVCFRQMSGDISCLQFKRNSVYTYEHLLTCSRIVTLIFLG